MRSLVQLISTRSLFSMMGELKPLEAAIPKTDNTITKRSIRYTCFRSFISWESCYRRKISRAKNKGTSECGSRQADENRPLIKIVYHDWSKLKNFKKGLKETSDSLDGGGNTRNNSWRFDIILQISLAYVITDLPPSLSHQERSRRNIPRL